MFENVIYIILVVILVLIVLGLLFFGGCAIYNECTKVEVETYTVGCEVSQMAYAEETISRSSSKPVFKMGVRNDDFACTFDISDAEFAKYAVGDVVDVEVTVWELHDGSLHQTYKLVG